MTGEFMVPANGVDLCVQTFGAPADPPLLLIAGGASSMDWWEDGFCERLAAGGRRVIRYDHRDTGRSTSYPAGAPGYTHADLADDAVGLLDALIIRRAHIAGLSMGGGLAQRIAIHHPHRVRTLTLMSTSAGPAPDDAHPQTTPDPDRESIAASEGATTTGPVESDTAGRDAHPSDTAGRDAHPSDTAGSDAHPSDTAGSDAHPSDTAAGAAADEPERFDWSDRQAAVERLVAEVRQYGGPLTASPDHLRRLAERVTARTRDMAASQTNHWVARSGPPQRHLLGTVTAPTLIMHGTLDPLFPMTEAETLAKLIPGARLLPLENVGHEFPPAPIWPTVVEELLNHTA